MEGIGIRDTLVQEGRSQEAEGRKEESLYSKVFNLFSVVGYFCCAALGTLAQLSVVVALPITPALAQITPDATLEAERSRITLASCHFLM